MVNLLIITPPIGQSSTDIHAQHQCALASDLIPARAYDRQPPSNCQQCNNPSVPQQHQQYWALHNRSCRFLVFTYNRLSVSTDPDAAFLQTAHSNLLTEWSPLSLQSYHYQRLVNLAYYETFAFPLICIIMFICYFRARSFIVCNPILKGLLYQKQMAYHAIG